MRQMLDAKGRCCGCKPLLKKVALGGSRKYHLFCPRCDRSYDATSGQQISNLAWDGKGKRRLGR